MNPSLTRTDSRSGPQDRLKPRLLIGLAASVVLNLALWRGAAAIAKHPPVFTPQPVEITRVILDDKGHKTEKVVTQHAIQRKVEKAHQEIEQRRPVVLPPPKPTPQPIRSHPVRSQPAKVEPQPFNPPPVQATAPPPPQGAHSNVLTAPPDKNSAAKSDDHTALPGGNAPVGAPIEHQNPGGGVANPPERVKTDPKPPPKVEPKIEPKADPPQVKPPKADPPKPENVAPPMEPVKPEPPKPKGPSREAQPENQSQPEIPDELKRSEFKSFVRVKVEIEADGSFTPILRTSSGNAEIDRRVLESLKKWKWKPALKDGQPVKSVQLFKFEFEVQ